jgi:hypothetical protein
MAIVLVSHRPGVMAEADITFLLHGRSLRRVDLSCVEDLHDALSGIDQSDEE